MSQLTQCPFPRPAVCHHVTQEMGRGAEWSLQCAEMAGERRKVQLLLLASGDAVRVTCLQARTSWSLVVTWVAFFLLSFSDPKIRVQPGRSDLPTRRRSSGWPWSLSEECHMQCRCPCVLPQLWDEFLRVWRPLSRKKPFLTSSGSWCFRM